MVTGLGTTPTPTPLGGDNPKRKVFKTLVLILACIVWIGAIALGMKILWTYKSTPGSSGVLHSAQWPVDSSIKHHSDRPTLLIFGHPHCPCTRASMNELARLAARFHNQIHTYVIFTIADDVPKNWEKTQLLETASSIEGTKVILDQNGIETARFGVETSGHTLLYNTKGLLLFSGGITSIRGHEGDSFGRQRIISILSTGAADRSDSPVFGCALLGPEASDILKRKKENH